MSDTQWFWFGWAIAFIIGVAARPYIDRMMRGVRSGFAQKAPQGNDPVEHQVDDYNYQR